MVEKEQDLEPLASPPVISGTYALILSIPRHLEVQVGRLGRLDVLPGFYGYVGRHCRWEKRLRWHVDYLRDVAQIEEIWYNAGSAHCECPWARGLERLPGASLPMPGFGASDCRCRSHLIAFRTPPPLDVFRQRFCGKPIYQLRLGQERGVRPVADAAG